VCVCVRTLLFRPVAVFDETDREDLPELPCEPITGDSHAEHQA
jgi:hypothetical protein